MIEELSLTARLFCATILASAALSKVTGRQAFLEGVQAYRILPPPGARLFANIAPWLELGTGILLVLGLFTEYAAVGALLLIVMFVIATLVNLARGRELDCHCFSSLLPERIGWASLIRQAVMILALIWIAVNGPGHMALDASPASTVGAEHDSLAMSDLVPSWILASLAVMFYLQSTQLQVVWQVIRTSDVSNEQQ